MPYKGKPWYEARKRLFQAHPRALRRGHVDPSSGLVFFGYNAGTKGFEVWLSRDVFSSRVDNVKRHNARKDFAISRKCWKRRQYNENPNYKLVNILRSRLHAAVNRKSSRKLGTTIEMLGCDPSVAKDWIERQFQPGMTWDNLGTVWHIDHVLPFAAVDQTPDAIAQVAHYTNLRPLAAAENLARPKDGSDLVSRWPRACATENAIIIRS